MPDFAVRTTFTAVDRLSPAFARMGTAADSFASKGSGAASIVGQAFSVLNGLLPVFGAAMAATFLKSTVDAARSMQRLETAFESVFQKDAGKQMEFVRTETHRLGLEFMRSAEAYKGIAASAKGTAINNKIVQETFLGVAEASSALQLTGEQTEGALLAISQIISKGKVSMEELRGQLSERIPGAMQTAARAMGMTTMEFEKFVAQGISAEVFIPKFAAQMRKEFGPAAAAAALSFNAMATRFSDSIMFMKVNIGTALLPALISISDALSPVIKDISSWAKTNRDIISNTIKEAVPYIGAVVGLFLAWKAALLATAIVQGAFNAVLLVFGAIQKGIQAIQFVAYMWQMRNVVMASARAHIVLNGITGLYNFLLGGTRAGLILSAFATKALAAAQWLLNTAMLANPLGLMILLLAGLVGWVTVAILNWDTWGASMLGMLGPIGQIIGAFKAIYDAWETIKKSFSEGGLWDGLKSLGGVAFEGFTKTTGMKGIKDQATLDPFATGTENRTAPNSTEVESKNLLNVLVNVMNAVPGTTAEVTPKQGAKVNFERLAEGYNL